MDLSVNICAHNNRDFLRGCLRSLAGALQGISHEILVVENASADGTAEMISSDFPHVRVIQNRANNGVARARNQSIRRSQGRYILLLDADTEVPSGNVAGLLQYMDSHPQVGLLGVKQLNFDGRVYPAARTFPTLRNIIVNRLSFLDRVKNSSALRAHLLIPCEQNGPAEVDYLIGSFQLIRREVFGRVGLLDEGMFWGFEDADFCARLRKAGYKSVYYPGFAIKHFVQARTRRALFSLKGMMFLGAQINSYVRFYAKHHDLWGRNAGIWSWGGGT